VAHQRLLARAQRIEDPALCHRFLHAVAVNARILDLAEEWATLSGPVDTRSAGGDTDSRPRPPTGSNAAVS
jgi:hypothetical protein